MKGYMMRWPVVFFFDGGGREGEGSSKGREVGTRGREAGARGREVGVRGEGSGGWAPPCPPPQSSASKR